MRRFYLKATALLTMVTVQACSLQLAQANIESDMANMFNSMGAQTSYSTAGAYHSQSSSLYTGGGFSAKFGNKTLYPAQIQLPSVTAGCGGIDFFSGAFSFANKEQFVEFTRNLGNNAAGVAFEIALDALDPLVGGAISKIRDIVNYINQNGLNSCQAARQAVNGLAGVVGTSLVKECEATTVGDGTTSDGAESRWWCKDKGREVAERLKQRSNYMSNNQFNKTSIEFTGGNVTLMALQNFSISQEEKQWLLSIIGTYAAPKPPEKSQAESEGAGPKGQFYFPTIRSSSEIVDFIGVKNGNDTVNIPLLRCFDPTGGISSSDPYKATKCEVETKPYKSLKSLVLQRIEKLKSNISNGTRPNSADQQDLINLVDNSSLPLLKMAIFDQTSGNNISDKVADVITLDLARAYLTNLTKASAEVIGTYQTQGGGDVDAVKTSIDNIKEAMSVVRQEAAQATAKANNEVVFSNYLKEFDSHFKSSFPSISGSIAFSKLLGQ